jgi:hypothetical protein
LVEDWIVGIATVVRKHGHTSTTPAPFALSSMTGCSSSILEGSGFHGGYVESARGCVERMTVWWYESTPPFARTRPCAGFDCFFVRSWRVISVIAYIPSELDLGLWFWEVEECKFKYCNVVAGGRRTCIE